MRARSSSTTITLCRARRAARRCAPPAGIYRNGPATGVARVVCYSPRHDITLAELEVDGVDALLATWQDQMRSSRRIPTSSSS